MTDRETLLRYRMRYSKLRTTLSSRVFMLEGNAETATNLGDANGHFGGTIEQKISRLAT